MLLNAFWVYPSFDGATLELQFLQCQVGAVTDIHMPGSSTGGCVSGSFVALRRKYKILSVPMAERPLLGAFGWKFLCHLARAICDRD